ncbi:MULTISPECIES: DUF2254 family protein [unclassified Streptomyces]|uniref:DUF2254 family protein n=1 Tax=unclassified Streptomyces TaxID=2593676 RepID=UPI0037F3290F
MAAQVTTRRPVHSRGIHHARRLHGRSIALILVVGGGLLGWFLPLWERHLPTPGLGFDTSTAQATLASVAGSMITLAGFIVTAITLIVQTVQAMSPRLVAALGHFSRYLVLFGLLIGTALYALVTLSHVRGDSVPRLSVTLAVVLVLLDAVIVLRLLASLRHAVTGGGLSRAVGERLRAAIDLAHPAAAETGPEPRPFHEDQVNSFPAVHRGRPSTITWIDEERITRLAARHHVRIRLTHAVGDFAGTGQVVADVEAEGTDTDPRLARRVSACIRYGPSRSLRQDAAYGLRLLADIAIRALSPGINDPTTAVQALDQIENALLRLAHRPLGPVWLVDAHDTPRVRLHAPQWEDLVSLALDETLLYGSSTPQTVRRLNALLLSLLSAAPPSRRPPITDRAEALERLAAARLPDPLLHHVASQPDRQGLGGTAAPQDTSE